MKKFWYTARVKNSSGIHAVFYACTRPRIGSTCEGVAKPNRVVGFQRKLVPYLERGQRT